jgi:hypothetical protein
MHRTSFAARRRNTALLCATVLLLTTIVVIGGGVAGCTRKPESVTVPLRFRPTARLDLNAFGGAAPQTGVYVGDVRDGRAVKNRIGENAVGNEEAPVYSGGREPTEFVGLVMKDLLRRGGLKVAGERTAAGLIILPELHEFWARETTTYGATVAVTVTVQDRAGGQLWKGLVTATSRRPGPSLDAGDYQEIFSDATLELVERLLHDDGFRQALQTGVVVSTH